MVGSLPRIINNTLIGLNLVVFFSIFLSIFIYFYYCGDKKKINKFFKRINTEDRTIGDKIYNFLITTIFTFWGVLLLISFANNKVNAYVVDYKNCESAISQGVIDLERISNINNDLFIYQTLSKYDVLFIKNDVKQELLSFEYLQIRSE